ncbi:aminoacyl-histidine dipeptidase [Clostridiisalibacter paucivorans]|uniref:aminoacyl-histidine dipeptidase n=1 Tax=Clostridiisalibacter paucivorans TaxID=408753 RepID=UPI0004793026|nr:aminoacyl-histidine dipeptidase [Clostridiisalibacter paucivorans]
MGSVLKDLEPKEVLKYFEEITKIPRCSGKEKEMSDHLVYFAKKRNLEVIQDNAMNVIIKKPGTSGYENAPVVIIQGHMDMVCEKTSNSCHDFEKDPLKLQIDGDMLKATDTTLGGDNGIAVAYAVALLDSEDIPHPPLEVLLTTEEETGMGGASQINPEDIEGKILINIDSEEEGVLLVSCAGGMRVSANLPINWHDISEGYIPYTLKVKGLKGGHSGMEINKERGNSNKILGRILSVLDEEMDISLADLKGGSKTNAIPREAEAIILIDKSNENRLKDKVNYLDKIIKNELKTADPNVTIEIERYDGKIDAAFSKDTKKGVIFLLNMIPTGVQTMSMDIEGLVQSSNNLGIVSVSKDEVVFQNAIRSSVKSLKYEIYNRIKIASDMVDAQVDMGSEYPEWQYRKDSYIRDVFERVYEDMYEKKPNVTAIHAGLECGLFAEKLGDVDMISFGPNMYDVHTPQESLSISSVKRTWDYLLGVLKEIK